MNYEAHFKEADKLPVSFIGSIIKKNFQLAHTHKSKSQVNIATECGFVEGFLKMLAFFNKPIHSLSVHTSLAPRKILICKGHGKYSWIRRISIYCTTPNTKPKWYFCFCLLPLASLQNLKVNNLDHLLLCWIILWFTFYNPLQLLCYVFVSSSTPAFEKTCTVFLL